MVEIKDVGDDTTELHIDDTFLAGWSTSALQKYPEAIYKQMIILAVGYGEAKARKSVRECLGIK